MVFKTERERERGEQSSHTFPSEGQRASVPVAWACGERRAEAQGEEAGTSQPRRARLLAGVVLRPSCS